MMKETQIPMVASADYAIILWGLLGILIVFSIRVSVFRVSIFPKHERRKMERRLYLLALFFVINLTGGPT
jgi:hypothetical protein